MADDFIHQLQVTVDDCRRLAGLMDDTQIAQQLLELADELEGLLDRAASAKLGASDVSPGPRQWGSDKDK